MFCNDYRQLILTIQISPVCLHIFKVYIIFFLNVNILLSTSSVISPNQIFDWRTFFNLAYFFFSSKMFQWYFRPMLFFASEKLSFSLSRSYCHGRLTRVVRSKKTCQTCCALSVNGSFIYSVIQKVGSSFRRTTGPIYILYI